MKSQGMDNFIGLEMKVCAHDKRMDDHKEDKDYARSSSKEYTPKNIISKCPKGSPTMCNPLKEQKIVPLQETLAGSDDLGPRCLMCTCMSGVSVIVKEKWCNDELKVVLFHSSGELHLMGEAFWNSA